MSYQSPIELIMSDMNTHIESAILEAIEKVGVVIDKDELIRAIRYDRNQYQKGYDDRDAKIVRCKDCKHYKPNSFFECSLHGACQPKPDWYCADGERWEENG